MRTRLDTGLGFLLQYEHVAWFEAGCVRILDRRIYPARVEFVTCTSFVDVAQAIADMVTQSGGPYIAAAMGMALAAWEVRDRSHDAIVQNLTRAAYVLSHARPTTSAKMEAVTTRSLIAAQEALDKGITGTELVELLRQLAIDQLERMHRTGMDTGRHLAKLVPTDGTIMTQCFAETYIGHLIQECRKLGKEPRFICPETRPYFQGARLTASVAREMDADVTVISDNMPGYTMQTRHVDLFTSASDVITMDGHIVNKVGTFQIALCANYFGIPYYCTGNPNPACPDMSHVTIEERDPELTLTAMGTKTTLPGVKGYYPAFDVTPPELCTGIATDRGILLPGELSAYFA